MTPDSLAAQLIRGCQHINIPVRTMHKIRKTYASILVNNGVEITIVKEMLGHASEETTFRHYIYNTSSDEATHSIVTSVLEKASKLKKP